MSVLERDMTLAAYLKGLRKQAGKTQVEVAAETGLSVIFISLMENGKERPSKRSLAKLAAAYEVPEDEMLEQASRSRQAGRSREARRGGRTAALMAPASGEGRTEVADEEAVVRARLDSAVRYVFSDPLVKGQMEVPDNLWAQLFAVRFYQLLTNRVLLTEQEIGWTTRWVGTVTDKTGQSYIYTAESRFVKPGESEDEDEE